MEATLDLKRLWRDYLVHLLEQLKAEALTPIVQESELLAGSC